MCVSKLEYGIESKNNSQSANSHLSDECMLFNSIHTLAKLSLKETVPPQPRTSPHVTPQEVHEARNSFAQLTREQAGIPFNQYLYICFFSKLKRLLSKCITVQHCEMYELKFVLVHTRVARLAFLRPNSRNLAFFEVVWHEK